MTKRSNMHSHKNFGSLAQKTVTIAALSTMAVGSLIPTNSAFATDSKLPDSIKGVKANDVSTKRTFGDVKTSSNKTIVLNNATDLTADGTHSVLSTSADNSVPSKNTVFDTKANLSDAEYRVLTNGYPYVSASKLGAKNADEANAITRIAMWISEGDFSFDNINWNSKAVKSDDNVDDQVTAPEINRVKTGVQNLLETASNSKVTQDVPKLSSSRSNGPTYNKDGSTDVSYNFGLNNNGSYAGDLTIDSMNVPDGTVVKQGNNTLKEGDSVDPTKPLNIHATGHHTDKDFSIKLSGSANYIQGTKYSDSKDQGNTSIVAGGDVKKAGISTNIAESIAARVGNVKTTAVNKDNNAQKDTKVTLYNKAEEPVATKTTDDSGNATFKDVPYGDYTVGSKDGVNDVTVDSDKTETVVQANLITDSVLSPDISSTVTAGTDRQVNPARNISVSNVVSMKKLLPLKKYKLVSTVYDMDTGQPVKVDNKPVTGSVTFRSLKTTASKKVSLDANLVNAVNNSGTKNYKVVTQLKAQGIVIGITVAKDALDDGNTNDQFSVVKPDLTITPKIKTDSDQQSMTAKVDFKNVVANQPLEFTAVATDKNGKARVIKDGTKSYNLVGRVKFTPRDTSGTITMSFKKIDPSKVNMDDLNATAITNIDTPDTFATNKGLSQDDLGIVTNFDKAVVGSEDTTKTSPAGQVTLDKDSKAKITAITALNGANVTNPQKNSTVEGVVSYSGLTPGKEVRTTVMGTNPKSNDLLSLTINGKKYNLIGQVDFTPKAATGSVTVPLKPVEASDQNGLVVTQDTDDSDEDTSDQNLDTDSNDTSTPTSTEKQHTGLFGKIYDKIHNLISGIKDSNDTAGTDTSSLSGAGSGTTTNTGSDSSDSTGTDTGDSSDSSKGDFWDTLDAGAKQGASDLGADIVSGIKDLNSQIKSAISSGLQTGMSALQSAISGAMSGGGAGTIMQANKAQAATVDTSADGFILGDIIKAQINQAKNVNTKIKNALSSITGKVTPIKATTSTNAQGDPVTSYKGDTGQDSGKVTVISSPDQLDGAITPKGTTSSAPSSTASTTSSSNSSTGTTVDNGATVTQSQVATSSQAGEGKIDLTNMRNQLIGTTAVITDVDETKALAVDDTVDDSEAARVTDPQIKSTQTIDGDKTGNVSSEMDIEDNVQYTDFAPGEKVTLSAVDMTAGGKKVASIAGNKLAGSVTFTPKDSDGTQAISMSIGKGTIPEKYTTASNTDVSDSSDSSSATGINLSNSVVQGNVADVSTGSTDKTSDGAITPQKSTSKSSDSSKISTKKVSLNDSVLAALNGSNNTDSDTTKVGSYVAYTTAELSDGTVVAENKKANDKDQTIELTLPNAADDSDATTDGTDDGDSDTNGTDNTNDTDVTKDPTDNDSSDGTKDSDGTSDDSTDGTKDSNGTDSDGDTDSGDQGGSGDTSDGGGSGTDSGTTSGTPSTQGSSQGDSGQGSGSQLAETGASGKVSHNWFYNLFFHTFGWIFK